MPLFLLPMLLVRIVKFGPSALRFSATTDVVSGDTARWGHGVHSGTANGIDQLAPVRMW